MRIKCVCVVRGKRLGWIYALWHRLDSQCVWTGPRQSSAMRNCSSKSPSSVRLTAASVSPRSGRAKKVTGCARTHSLSLFTVSARCRMQHGNSIFPNPGCRAVRQPCNSNWRHAKAGPGVPPRVCRSGPGAIITPAPSQQPERHEAGRGMREPAAHRENR